MPRTPMPAMLALLALSIAPIQATASTALDSIPTVAVRTVDDNSLLGAAVLVAIDSSGQEPMFIFVTARGVIGAADQRSARHVRLEAPSGVSMDVASSQIISPTDDTTGLTFIQMPWPECELRPPSIDLTGPNTRGVFMLVGIGADGSVRQIAERVQSRTPDVLTGEHPITDLPAPLGTPALSVTGLFGIVTEAQPDRAPVVALLSSANRLLSRHVPSSVGAPTAPTPASLFQVKEKRIGGPMLSVNCDTERSGELEVPYRLAPNERAVDASASFTHAQSVRLADLTVLSLDERTIKLRFTLIGVPPPPFAVPGPCIPGQALVTVRVNVVSFPPQE